MTNGDMTSGGAPHADWSGWPLVEIDANAVPPARASRLTLDVLRAALDRTGAFVVVARMPATPSGRRRLPPREALALIRELKAIRPGLVRRCKALVFVMSPDEQERHRARLASSDRFWGCPVEVAERLDNARALAHARLAAGG